MPGSRMLDEFLISDPKIQSSIISALVTVAMFVLGWIFKIIYDKHSLNYKLKQEYTFEQKKRIKEGISKTKTPLLQASESLNHRFWNLESNIDEKWLERQRNEWTVEEHHYLRSFVYRWLCLVFWILKAEKSVGEYDGTLSPKVDLLYLKYVKTIKFCLCDRLLLEKLDYTVRDTSNHFYIDDLPKFASYLENDGAVISYYEFEEKLNANLMPIEKVFMFFSSVNSDGKNKNLNLLRVLHLIVISFLNRFGHEYQETSSTKVNELLSGKYGDIAIKAEFLKFLERHKIEKDMKWITKKVGKQ